MTLKEVWERQGMTATSVAALARISLPTLYKANRKERISNYNIGRICNALNLSRTEYDALLPGK